MLARVGEPIHVLLFVGPLILLYEVGLALVLAKHADLPDLLKNLAHHAILEFIAVFGVGFGLSMPGILLLVVLVIWQVLSRASWRPDWRVLPWMIVESATLALPLIVVSQFIARGLPAVAGYEDVVRQLDVPSRLVISLGAGIYEEMLFRMALILGVHTLLVDVGRASNRVGTVVAIVVSAVAFAAFHRPLDPGGAMLWPHFVFYLIAGAHFAVIFVKRGFGIAVGTHVCYDLMVVLWLLPDGA